MNYLCLDVETTGTNPNIHSIIQLAAIMYDKNGVVVDKFNKSCYCQSVVILGALKVNRQRLSTIRAVSNPGEYTEI